MERLCLGDHGLDCMEFHLWQMPPGRGWMKTIQLRIEQLEKMNKNYVQHKERRRALNRIFAVRQKKLRIQQLEDELSQKDLKIQKLEEEVKETRKCIEGQEKSRADLRTNIYRLKNRCLKKKR